MVQEKVIKRVEKIATKMVDKSIGSKLKKMSVAEQVVYAEKIMKLSGIPEMRKNMLNGLESEFLDDIKKNPSVTYEELSGKYLECIEWCDFWKKLELEEVHLQGLYDNARQEYNRQQEKEQDTRLANHFPKKQKCPMNGCNKNCKRVKGKIATYNCSKHGDFMIGRKND